MTENELIDALVAFTERTGVEWEVVEAFDDALWIRFEKFEEEVDDE
jgi:hypothetical protein